jgi:hypothetical protein
MQTLCTVDSAGCSSAGGIEQTLGADWCMPLLQLSSVHLFEFVSLI